MAAAHSVSMERHFNIPEGTTTIVSRPPWGEGKCSWEEWGMDKKTVKTVTIPASVTNIGAWAFRECTSFASITIPDSVTYIGNRAFSGCSSLMALVVQPVLADEGGAPPLELWTTLMDRHTASVTRVWAPDAIVNQLTGLFAEYSTFAEIP